MRALLAALLLSLVVSACGAAVPSRPGSADVYTRIAALTDCAALQAEFNTAEANGKRDRDAGRTEQATWATAYMKAADERMKSLKCYWVGEGDNPQARRGGSGRELIATSQKTCPHDGQELVKEPSALGALEFTQYRRCPKCGRGYSASPMTDFAVSKLFPSLFGGAVPTLPRIESAQIETGKLEEKVDELRVRLDRVQEELPAPNVAVAAVREELGALEGRLGDVGRSLEEVRRDLLGLIPDATDLAYMKLAKAEVADLRGLVTRHLEDDHRRRNLAESGRANRVGWAGVVVGVLGVIAGAVIAIFGR